MINKRIASVVLGLALVIGATPASAQTLSDLQAQIAALMAQIATLQGGSSVSASFTQNLTVGSTGSEVVALQQMLVAKGFLVMPAGTAYGYFGGLTKAAVVKWQLANGVSPAVGYFGPISRAKANAMGGITTGGTTTGGTTTGGTTTSGGITTPGVEGTLTATIASTPGSGVTLREGDSKEAVLGVKLEAKLSDIKVERIKLQLEAASGGNVDRDFYRDAATKVYIMDGSTVVGSASLNSDTVVEETTGNYYVTIAGMNVIVSKDSTKTLTIALDADDSYDSGLTGDTWTVTIPTDGIRGVDGAGVNQYAPSSGTISRTFTTDTATSDDASITVSTGSNTPLTGEVVAADGSDDDELDGLALLSFDVKAQDDDVTITDLTATITNSGAATTTTAYLYSGSTLVGSADVSGTTAVFDDIDFTISEDATKTLTLKVDVRDAATTATTFIGSVANGDITAENSQGDVADVSGSATGNTITVRKVGPQFTLLSKSITKSATASQNNTSTSTVSADFSVQIKAVGGDIYFGTQSASSTFVFQTYKGGTATTLLVASSTNFETPSTGVVTSGLTAEKAFKLQEGNTVTVPVHFIFEGRTTAGALVSTDSYAVGLESIKWSATGNDTQTSSFMAGKTEWRTSTVTLP